MSIELIPALLAGAIAAFLMALARMGMKKMGMNLRMDVMSMLGKMVNSGRKVGMLIHIALGAILGLVYAWIFVFMEASLHLWLLGLLVGFAHWIVAGILLSMMPGVSAFAKNFGKQDIMGFLIGHLLFGLLVGTCYAYLITVYI